MKSNNWYMIRLKDKKNVWLRCTTNMRKVYWFEIWFYLIVISTLYLAIRLKLWHWFSFSRKGFRKPVFFPAVYQDDSCRVAQNHAGGPLGQVGDGYLLGFTDFSICDMYRKISNISCSKSPNLYVSRLVVQLSSPSPMKPGVKSRMKM